MLYWHAWFFLKHQWHHHAFPWLYLPSARLSRNSYFNQALAIAAYSAPPSPFDSHAHLLHGVVHANGFGHLARVNGREGGSQQLSGVDHHILTLTDNQLNCISLHDVCSQ